MKGHLRWRSPQLGLSSSVTQAILQISHQNSEFVPAARWGSGREVGVEARTSAGDYGTPLVFNPVDGKPKPLVDGK